MSLNFGILTAGGDCPGLNAAIRGLGKALIQNHGAHVIGFLDGFRGLAENRFVELNTRSLSGILTQGGTILGTSRDKPHKMPMAGLPTDMTDVIVENYERNHLDGLICLGGNGTQKNAWRLAKKGLNVLTLPKTIDNDILKTDMSFGFDTALSIATEAIDRLHSTAHSHHRIIIVEVMGHQAGWLTLGAGISGGADVILIPEIPYTVQSIADSILKRKKSGKSFSIVAIAEGAMSVDFAKSFHALENRIKETTDKKQKAMLKVELSEMERIRATHTLRLTQKLTEATGLEARLTILGHVQRGGIPSPADRLLATTLGTACADMAARKKFGYMMAVKGNEIKPVEIEKVIKGIKNVPPDHYWVQTARSAGTCMGD